MYNLVSDNIFHSAIKITGDITNREITDKTAGFCLADLFKKADSDNVTIIGKVASLEVVFNLCSVNRSTGDLYFIGHYCNHSTTGYSCKTKYIELSKKNGKYYLNSHTGEE